MEMMGWWWWYDGDIHIMMMCLFVTKNDQWLVCLFVCNAVTFSRELAGTPPWDAKNHHFFKRVSWGPREPAKIITSSKNWKTISNLSWTRRWEHPKMLLLELYPGPLRLPQVFVPQRQWTDHWRHCRGGHQALINTAHPAIWYSSNWNVLAPRSRLLRRLWPSKYVSIFYLDDIGEYIVKLQNT